MCSSCKEEGALGGRQPARTSVLTCPDRAPQRGRHVLVKCSSTARQPASALQTSCSSSKEEGALGGRQPARAWVLTCPTVPSSADDMSLLSLPSSSGPELQHDDVAISSDAASISTRQSYQPHHGGVLSTLRCLVGQESLKTMLRGHGHRACCQLVGLSAARSSRCWPVSWTHPAAILNLCVHVLV